MRREPNRAQFTLKPAEPETKRHAQITLAKVYGSEGWGTNPCGRGSVFVVPLLEMVELFESGGVGRLWVVSSGCAYPGILRSRLRVFRVFYT
jgi:hypothetical protein